LGPNFEDAKAKSDEVRSAPLTAEQRKTKRMEIAMDLHSKVHVVLTPEQRAQLKMGPERPKPSM